MLGFKMGETDLPDTSSPPNVDALLPPDQRGLSPFETGQLLAASPHSREWIEEIALWADLNAPLDVGLNHPLVIRTWFDPSLGNLPGFMDWMLAALLCNQVLRPFAPATESSELIRQGVRGWARGAVAALAAYRLEQLR